MNIEIPKILSFQRKLEISDGIMRSGKWDELENITAPIEIIQRKILSTQSSFGIDDKKKALPNPVSSGDDDANLPFDHDTLKLSFTLRILGDIGTPCGCNEAAIETIIKQKIDLLKENNVLGELAIRYAYNIANGRFLWRNKLDAQQILIKVSYKNEEKETLDLSFNAYDFTVKDFNKNRENEDLRTLADIFQQGFLGEKQSTFIKVDAFVLLGDGQHVFPSQEMNIDDKKAGKVLFSLNNCAAMHSVKLGNAIRTIDDWYPNAEFPIAVEPYGAVTQRGIAYRPNKNDLYTLLKRLINQDDLTKEEKSFVFANIIRGGIFNGKGNTAKAKKKT